MFRLVRDLTVFTIGYRYICFLAGSNNYSLSSIDEFNSFIAKFGSEMAVTQYGNKNDQGSTPVILWGIENEVATAFAPPRIKYHSVIRYLCDKGYIYTREKFLNSHDFDPQQWLCGKMRFDDWFKNINDVSFVVKDLLIF